MRLFIRVKDGKAFEHPVTEENLKMIYEDFDPNNPPEGFVKFQRYSQPVINTFEVNEGISYEWNGDIIEDVWHIRPMTNEEKQEKIEFVKNMNHPKGWIFDENNCSWSPPFLPPDNQNFYVWDDDIENWKSS